MLTLRLCLLYRSQNKQRLLACIALTDWFCVTEVESVYCAVRTESCKVDTFFISLFFLNYILKITIYSLYSMQGKSYKIVLVTNLTEISTWSKSYIEGKVKIISVNNTKKNTMPGGELVYSSICFGRLCL